MVEIKADFVRAMRIIQHEGLSDAFAHLSARVDQDTMLFMPRRSPALVSAEELFTVSLDEPVPQSGVHQAVYRARQDVQSVIHFHSPAVVLLSVLGQAIRPLHNYSAMFYQGVPLFEPPGQVETRERAEKIAGILGDARAVVLRGHGAVVVGSSIPEVCFLALCLEESARLQTEAMRLGEPLYLSAEEAEHISKRTFKPASIARAWEHFCALVDDSERL